MELERDLDGALTRGLADRVGAGERRENELLLRDGIDGRENDRLLRDGVDGRRENELLLRDGIEDRGLGREIERLGVGRAVDLLGVLALRLADLLRDDPPSAASASNRTAAMAPAVAARPALCVSFTRIITYLLSPAVFLSGNPGLPIPALPPASNAPYEIVRLLLGIIHHKRKQAP